MTQMPGCTLFDTALGRCGVTWSERGVTGVQLPETSEARMRHRQRRRHACEKPVAPPPQVQRVIDGVVALLRGEPVDLRGVALDMEGVPAFHRRVYDVARDIMPGATSTYGDIAARLGDRLLARAVGEALGRNPFAIVVPCHRVLAAGGRSGGFSAAGGVATKLRMLAIEGARPYAESDLFADQGAAACNERNR
jgi:methylated-DNA-[protein]-cysteine S-methyltransferase